MQAAFYIVSAFALLIVSITMLARANDLRWRQGWKWNMRLAGFIFSGFSPVGVVFFDWMLNGVKPTLYGSLFYFGVMLVFFTTPNQKPWWQFIAGKEDEDAYHGVERRIGSLQ
jgi:hypothetical protein